MIPPRSRSVVLVRLVQRLLVPAASLIEPLVLQGAGGDDRAPPQHGARVALRAG